MSKCRNCGSCMKGKSAGGSGIWCVLFGIMINRKHDGCRYYSVKDEGNATTGNSADASAKEAAAG